MATRSSNYTKPELREKLKEKIKAGSKGAKRGPWSARKAQILANEYKEEGGDNKGAPTSGQKQLTKWSKEHSKKH